MKTSPAAWGLASLPLAGERESGDVSVVQPFDKGVLVAVVDALGHGQDAAHAAQVAATTLERYAHEGPVYLLRRCDELMRPTRGAAISVAWFETEQRAMTWLGVGNVTGALVRADPATRPRVKQLIVHSGVVGYHLPELHPSALPVVPGDLLVLATDGVRSDFADFLPAGIGPQALAERILKDYATRNDDALVLVFPCSSAMGQPAQASERRKA